MNDILNMNVPLKLCIECMSQIDVEDRESYSLVTSSASCAMKDDVEHAE